MVTIVAGKEDKDEDEEADTLVGMENLGVLQGFFIWGFQGTMPWKTLAIIIYLLFVLDFAIPSKYTPHLFTSEILLMAGVLVGVSLERLAGDIPHLWWAVFILLAIIFAVGVFWPFPAPDKQVADGVGR